MKVKSIAELRSTKIARLTTKIAVNEAEIARLEREYAAAKDRLDRETEALVDRRETLSTVAASASTLAKGETNDKTKAALQVMDDARIKLELVADRAQDLLIKFRDGKISEHATMRELKNLLEGAKDGGCDVAGLCQIVAGLQLGGTVDADVSTEPQTGRKRKVQDVRKEEKTYANGVAITNGDSKGVNGEDSSSQTKDLGSGAIVKDLAH